MIANIRLGTKIRCFTYLKAILPADLKTYVRRLFTNDAIVSPAKLNQRTSLLRQEPPVRLSTDVDKNWLQQPPTETARVFEQRTVDRRGKKGRGRDENGERPLDRWAFEVGALQPFL